MNLRSAIDFQPKLLSCLRNYNKETLSRDIMAGIIVGIVAIPLAIAGWMRYLLGVGDDGEAIEISADPMKDALMEKLAGIELGKPETYKGQLREILANLLYLGLPQGAEKIIQKDIATERDNNT